MVQKSCSLPKHRYSFINHSFSVSASWNWVWNWDNIIIVWKAGEGVSGIVHTAMHHCLFHLGVSGLVPLILFLNLKVISCTPFASFFSFHQLQIDLYRCVLQTTSCAVICYGWLWRSRPFKLHPECLSCFCCFPLNFVTFINLGTSLCDSYYRDASHWWYLLYPFRGMFIHQSNFFHWGE